MKNSKDFIFDSNIFINCYRDEEYAKGIYRFFNGGFSFKASKIVLMELWAGYKTALEKKIIQDIEATASFLPFNNENFLEAGKILHKISRKPDVDRKKRKSLTWDILIALNARDNQALIVTENIDDFKTIRKHISFQFQAPIRLAK